MDADTVVTECCIPQILINTRNWVAWWEVRGTGERVKLPNGSWTRKALPVREKPYKVPINPRTGGAGVTTNLRTWGTYQQALGTVHRFGVTGIGYVFSDAEPCSGIDLDNCRDPATGIIADWAQAIMAEMETYTEVSPSSTGVKLWVIGKVPNDAGKRCKYEGGHVEIYSRAQFFTVTGQHLPGTPVTVESRQSELLALQKRILPAKPKPNIESRDDSGRGCPDDDDLLRRVRAARNGGKFSRLFDDGSNEGQSPSEADIALCGFLAYWTGKDGPRIDRLFRRSALMRDKWNREDYRTKTMDKAIANTRNTFHPKKQKAAMPTVERKPPGSVVSEDPSPAASDDDSTKRGNDAHSDRVATLVGRSPTSKMIQLLGTAELFHTAESKPYATVLRDGHRETHLIASKAFRSYANWLYFKATKSAISNKSLAECIAVLVGRAQFEGGEHEVCCRLGAHEGAIYFDLGGDAWEFVQVTSSGWTIVQDSPVKFRRTQGMLEIPPPRRVAGAPEHLRQMLNSRSGSHDEKLILAWLLAAMRPVGPYPPLVLNSEHGSGKTTLSKVLRALIDPNQAPMRAQPKDAHDLAISAENSWLIALDNLSHVPDWLSDAICRLSTGGGFGTRALYTNDDESLFNAQRPVIVNGIDDIVTKDDLMDRALILKLEKISERKRITEREFWATFDEQRSGILGYLLDCVCGAMRELPNVHLESLPRMADFVEWVQAAEPTLGWQPGLFRQAYDENREEANDIVIDAAAVARALASLADWSGNATQLLATMNSGASAADRAQKGWPKSPRGMSAAVRRANPLLRTLGVTAAFARESDSGRGRIITIERGAPNAS